MTVQAIDEVIPCCRRLARRLTLRRFAERGAVLTALLAPAAALVQAALALDAHGASVVLVGGAWAAAVAVAAVVWLLPVRRRLGVSLSLAAAASAGGLVLVTVGLWLLLTGLAANWSGWVVPLSGVALAWAIAAAGLARPVSLATAAEWADRNVGLKDRMATALECIRGGRDDEQTRLIAAQAMDALQQRPVEGRMLWSRTRRTVAAAVLGAMVCGMAAWLASPPQGTDLEELLATHAARLDRRQRQQLARSLRNAARSADPQAANTLRSVAVHLVDPRDTEQLRRLLLELKRQGYDVSEHVPPEVMARLASMGSRGGDSDGGRQKDEGGIAGRDPNADWSAAGAARVFNPEYADLADANRPELPAAGSDTPPMGDYDDAWSRAKHLATEAARQGRIPRRYRGLVESYYRADQE
ncbi:MAG: hypothetical protein ACLFV7_09515 [Phycisphaerae bacterium]